MSDEESKRIAEQMARDLEPLLEAKTNEAADRIEAYARRAARAAMQEALIDFGARRTAQGLDKQPVI